MIHFLIRAFLVSLIADSKVFGPVVASKLMDLTNQNVDSLPSGVFSSNVSFSDTKYLYLSWNKLACLNESNFAGLNNLVKVSLYVDYKI